MEGRLACKKAHNEDIEKLSRIYQCMEETQNNPQDGVPDHMGIAERVENGRVHTVEGNSDDKCCQRSYSVGYYEIYGYGMLCR